jgi:protein tyrosine phosphatase (PTP) superfamily phosphohydrolase (DUF442 family)
MLLSVRSAGAARPRAVRGVAPPGVLPVAQRGALRFLLLCALLCAPPPGLADEILSPDDVEGPMTWSHAKRMYRVGDLYVGSQPFGADFGVAREKGIDLIISLQDPREKDWDERPMIWAYGLEFDRVALLAVDFDAEHLRMVNDLVKANAGRTVLVHCDNGNRAGAWLAFYLATEEGMSVDDAMAIGRRAGLVKDDLAEVTRRIIESAAP